jgi:hypothetical protein
VTDDVSELKRQLVWLACSETMSKGTALLHADTKGKEEEKNMPKRRDRQGIRIEPDIVRSTETD